MTEREQIARLAEEYTPEMVRFLQEMIAIPSESGGEQEVVARVAAEMKAALFDEVKIDGFGNVLGRIGSGARVIAMDAHLDTVGVGDRSTWTRDPYGAEIEDGVIYGRGASDQEGGMASMVYAAKIIKELHLDRGDDFQLWITGTVMEEDCDGLCWKYLIEEQVLVPEVVVITEPTDLGVYRGQRGRMEMEIHVPGKSCHGAQPELGVNAVYGMAPIVADIERLNGELEATADPFLGKGSMTVSHIRSTSPSLCAVADSCTIHIDRRLTHGETEERAVQQLRELESVAAARATVTVLEYAESCYTGLVYPTKKYYPTWVMEEDHAVVTAAVHTAAEALGRAPVVDKWKFSTNGIATCGVHGIPTVGFGPADERYAHTPEDQCPIEHLTAAARFYAAFPRHYLAEVKS